MIIPDDDVLMAYVDGELSPQQAQALEAAMAADPLLAAAVQRHRALRDTLRAAYAPVLDEAVPEHLAALLRTSSPAQRADNVVALVPRPPAEVPTRWGWPQWVGMAASLLLGVAVSQWTLKPEAASLQAGPAGEFVAGGALARGLQEQLASVPDPAGTVAVGLTFRDHDGHYCRSFVIEDAHVLAGLACRQPDGRWRVPVVMESETAATGGLRQAATALPPGLLVEAEARMGSDPLDAVEERKARDGGWR